MLSSQPKSHDSHLGSTTSRLTAHRPAACTVAASTCAPDSSVSATNANSGSAFGCRSGAIGSTSTAAMSSHSDPWLGRAMPRAVRIASDVQPSL